MAKKVKRQAPSLINRTPLRVRFSEVDSMQIVWHGEYVRYFEDGREAFGRQYGGLGYMEMYNSGYVVPLVKINLEFKYPLVCGDTAIVETRYISCEAAKIIFEYTIYRESDMQVVATGESTQVFLNRDNVLELVNPEFYIQWKKKWGVE
ncbi:acyl-CoA thioesterase [Acetobacteroides hydrogenigenes]|uniref:Acyl-CoA thioester hydrolase n=1 Tax=Acetobacteroides hydrogenigenes TaxID=979970 RepID=A0A4R2EFP5_9BACT|nr:thioesterase family protein [Acetobacteroides hydrogenigenes]TCN62889.1 acyl-CoA thioester hydrolase [Acetobacteroides hydrogenigenes]